MAKHQVLAEANRNRAQQKHYQPPPVEADKALMLGEAAVPMDTLTQGSLFTGAVGCGKTTAILGMLSQLAPKGIRVLCWDYKGEAWRLPVYLADAKVFSPLTAPGSRSAPQR